MTALQCEKDFSVLFNKYYGVLCLFATRILQDDVRAQEVVAEVFESLWIKDKWRQIENPNAFLYAAVHNRCIDIIDQVKIRKRHYFSWKMTAPITEDVILEQLVYAEAIRELAAAIATLPEQCQKVINMSYREGMKISEIAERLDVSPSTVKTQRARGIALLKKILSNRALEVASLFIKIF